MGMKTIMRMIAAKYCFLVLCDREHGRSYLRPHEAVECDHDDDCSSFLSPGQRE
jgi:hypothetical protein